MGPAATKCKSQNQLQISKQKQIQDQEYSYTIIGNFFSAIEWYTNRIGIEKKKEGLKTFHFEHYNNFECGKTKTLNELKAQIITQLEIFKYSYNMYIKEHGQYDFPKSLSKEQMISLITEWRGYVEEKDYILYDSIIKVMNGDSNVSLINILEKEVEKKGENGNVMNPKDILDLTKIVGKSQQMGEKVYDKLNKDPNYKPDIQLDMKEVGNKDLQTVGKEQAKRKQLEGVIKEKIMTIIDGIEKELGITEGYFKKNDGDGNPIQNENKDKSEKEKKDISIDNQITELEKLVNQYQKDFNDFYLDNSPNSLDFIIDYCQNTLKKKSDESEEKKELRNTIDTFICLLKKTKPESEA